MSVPLFTIVLFLVLALVIGMIIGALLVRAIDNGTIRVLTARVNELETQLDQARQGLTPGRDRRERLN